MYSIINYRSNHVMIFDATIYLFLLLSFSYLINNSFIRQDKQLYFIVSFIITFIFQICNTFVGLLILAQTSTEFLMKLSAIYDSNRYNISIFHIIIWLSYCFLLIEYLFVILCEYLN